MGVFLITIINIFLAYDLQCVRLPPSPPPLSPCPFTNLHLLTMHSHAKNVNVKSSRCRIPSIFIFKHVEKPQTTLLTSQHSSNGFAENLKLTQFYLTDYFNGLTTSELQA